MHMYQQKAINTFSNPCSMSQLEKQREYQDCGGDLNVVMNHSIDIKSLKKKTVVNKIYKQVPGRDGDDRYIIFRNLHHLGKKYVFHWRIRPAWNQNMEILNNEQRKKVKAKINK